MSMLQTIAKALSKLGVPRADANGDLLANIIPRSGTAATLAAVSNAGDGEVASLSDRNGLMRYLGSPVSVGSILSARAKLVDTLLFETSFTFIASANTDVQVGLAVNISGQAGIDTANNKIFLPAKVDPVKSRHLVVYADFIGANAVAGASTLIASAYISDALNVQTQSYAYSKQGAVLLSTANMYPSICAAMHIPEAAFLGEQSMSLWLQCPVGGVSVSAAIIAVEVYEY